jgi:hypothetical protein
MKMLKSKPNFCVHWQKCPGLFFREGTASLLLNGHPVLSNRTSRALLYVQN